MTRPTGQPGADMFRNMQEIYEEAVRVAEQLTPGPELTASFEGRDSAGAVQISTDEHGRVRDVVVSRAWASRVDAAALGEAVLEAAQDAAIRRLRAYGETVNNAAGPSRDGVLGRRRKASAPLFKAKPMQTPDDLGDPTTPEAQAAVSEVLSLLQGISTAMEDVESRIEERMTREVVGRSPSNKAVVTLRAGDAVGLKFDERWLARADHAAISQHIRQAFDSVYRQFGQLTVDSLVGSGPLGKIAAMTRDPEAFKRRLGIIR